MSRDRSAGNVTAEQIAAGKLDDLGKRIVARLDKVRAYEAKAREKAGIELRKADDHWNTLTQELAEAKAECDKGGFKAFKAKYCPNLSRARIYKLIAIGSGKKTLEESRAETRESVAQSRRAKVSPTSPVVGDKSAQPASPPPASLSSTPGPISGPASEPPAPVATPAGNSVGQQLAVLDEDGKPDDQATLKRDSEGGDTTEQAAAEQVAVHAKRLGKIAEQYGSTQQATSIELSRLSKIKVGHELGPVDAAYESWLLSLTQKPADKSADNEEHRTEQSTPDSYARYRKPNGDVDRGLQKFDGQIGAVCTACCVEDLKPPPSLAQKPEMRAEQLAKIKEAITALWALGANIAAAAGDLAVPEVSAPSAAWASVKPGTGKKSFDEIVTTIAHARYDLEGVLAIPLTLRGAVTKQSEKLREVEKKLRELAKPIAKPAAKSTGRKSAAAEWDALLNVKGLAPDEKKERAIAIKQFAADLKHHPIPPKAWKILKEIVPPETLVDYLGQQNA